MSVPDRGSRSISCGSLSTARTCPFCASACGRISRRSSSPGSRRLFELADSITEIKTICDCGRKATTNARISPDGYVVTEGDQVFLGGNDSYIAMCHKCYQDYINEHRKVELLHGTERDPQ